MSGARSVSSAPPAHLVLVSWKNSVTQSLLAERARSKSWNLLWNNSWYQGSALTLLRSCIVVFVSEYTKNRRLSRCDFFLKIDSKDLRRHRKWLISGLSEKLIFLVSKFKLFRAADSDSSRPQLSNGTCNVTSNLSENDKLQFLIDLLTFHLYCLGCLFQSWSM